MTIRLDGPAYITIEQLVPVLQEAERAGVQVEDVLQSFGYSSAALAPSQYHTRLSLVDFFRIEGEVARRLDDLTAHLSERKLTYETGAFITAQMNQSTTLASALNSLAQYFNMMHGEHYNSVRITDRTVTLITDDSAFPYTMKNDPVVVHFVGESVLIKVYCLLDSLSEGLASQALRRVSLKRAPSDAVPGHLQFWTAPISFGQGNYELCFDHELAHAPMSSPRELDLSSDGVFSRVISYLKRQTPSDRAQSYQARVLDLIRNGLTQQDAVAYRLSISVATLRRRLEEEGTSFRDLMSGHVLEQAMMLLRKGYSVSQVGEVLNYSDVRAFNRAFKRMTGQTPAQFAHHLT